MNVQGSRTEGSHERGSDREQWRSRSGCKEAQGEEGSEESRCQCVPVAAAAVIPLDTRCRFHTVNQASP